MSDHLIPFIAERAESAYAKVRLLSLDIVLAALGAGIMAVRLTGTHPRPAFYALLPAGTWVVYTLDHLLDARRQGSAAATPRHRFHARRTLPLAAACFVLAVTCAIVGFISLSWTGVGFAAVIAAAFVGHEAIVKLAGNRASPLLVKELGVAVIFTAGTWGLPLALAWHDREPVAWPLLMALQYALLALVNLIEFSIFELRIDEQQGQSSFVRAVGRRISVRLSVLLLVVQTLLATFVFILGTSPMVIADVIFFIMAAGLSRILLRPKGFVRNERYRALGDGVFLMPLLMGLV